MDELTSTGGLPFLFSEHATIDPIADQWDHLVPRDVPHLRAGFLRAAERGRMMREPTYLIVRSDGRPVAAALTYTVLMDTTMSASPQARRRIDWVRRWFPKFLWRPMRIFGPPVSNGECGIYFDPGLTEEQCRQILRRIIRSVESSAGRKQMIFAKEFNSEALHHYASELDQLGFFAVDPGPATSMLIRWNTFEEYLSALKKRYRRRIRDDLKAGEELDIERRESFVDLAPKAAALYQQVAARAKYNLEKATEGFFAAVSEFDQASLLVARHRATGEIVGVNLLLFGDTCMHNLYIGFDYEINPRLNVYFNLVERSLRIAIERKCQVCYFGPASYEFKTRLGATTFPLTAYMKHPVGFVHRRLYAHRDELWPKEEIPSHDVFQEEQVREHPREAKELSACPVDSKPVA
jgi:predicted N-acyltransferase